MDEAVDKAYKTGKIPNVCVKRSRGNSLVPGTARYEYTVSVQVGRTMLTVHRWETWHENYVPCVDGYSRLESKDIYALEKASEVANKLSSRGLAVQLNGEFYNLDLSAD